VGEGELPMDKNRKIVEASGMDLPRLHEAIARIEAAPHPPVPWRDGDRLPWHELAFSERMLRVHLDQTTHMASRTKEIINRHVTWLLGLLRRQQSRPRQQHFILDVGCGPGLYCHELARRGCTAYGFDCAPVPIAHARRVAQQENLDCRFWEADLTCLPEDWPAQVGPVDALTFWFAEFHAFRPQTAARFLASLARCLVPGGLFVLEYVPYDLFVKESSQQWQACQCSVFSDKPHFWLQEHSWDEQSQSEISVHWIIEAGTGELAHYTQCLQAYREDQLIGMLRRAGLGNPRFHPPITGCSTRFEFPLLVTRKLIRPDAAV
jgi:SAM-dependent methyltransferase